MNKFGLEVKVGALFIVTLLVLGYFSVKVGSIRFPWQEEGYYIKVYFDDIAGLEVKAPVRLAGVRIGQVTSIELENGKARVVAEIDPSIKIHRDAEANVSQMGVMGEKFLEIISRKGISPDYLKSGDTLLGSPPTSFDQVISVVNSIGHDIKAITSSMKRVMASREGEERMTLIVQNVERITHNLADVLGENQDNLRKTLDNLQQLTASLNGLVNANSDSVSVTMNNLEDLSETLSDNAPGLMNNLYEITAKLNTILPEEGQELQNSLGNLQSATADLKDTLASVRRMVDKVEDGEGTIGKLISEDETHDNINSALVSLEDTLQEAQTVLGRVNSYETSLGYRAEYLNGSESWKHFISLKIQPRHDKYYLLEVVDSPFGYLTEESTHTFTTTENTTTGEYEEVHVWEEESKVEDQFLINLQIAKELHNWTFRAGLIETHGGVGLDLGFWNKNIIFSADGWDFGRDELNFHLKFSGRFSLYHGIYVVGGWDDLLNDEIDSYFIGAGVLFTDEDLKFLLGLAAAAS